MSISPPAGNFFFAILFAIYFFAIFFYYFHTKKKKEKNRFCGRTTGHNFDHPLDRKQTFFKKWLGETLDVILLLSYFFYECFTYGGDLVVGHADSRLHEMVGFTHHLHVAVLDTVMNHLHKVTGSLLTNLTDKDMALILDIGM